MNINATFIIKSEHEIHTYVIFSSGYWIYLFDAVTVLYKIKNHENAICFGILLSERDSKPPLNLITSIPWSDLSFYCADKQTTPCSFLI